MTWVKHKSEGGQDVSEEHRLHQNVPNPDPSTLTTEALNAGLDNLRDLLEVQLQSTKTELEAFRLGHEEKHVSVVDAAIKHRKELSDASIAILRTQVDAQHQAHVAQVASVADAIDGKMASADLRYQQRYDAQTQALDAAFRAQQQATAAALAAAREAVVTALTSSEKAIARAEANTDKLIPRAEVEARMAEGSRRFEIISETLKSLEGLSDKVERVTESITGLDRVTDAKFITYRALIDSQSEKVSLALDAANKAVDAAFVSSAAAITKAENFNEKRFDLITKQIDELRAYQASDAGRSSIADPATAAALSASQEDVRSLRESRSAATGKSTGQTASWGYLVGAVSLVVVIVNVIIALATR